MDYEKKYKEALERASRLRLQNPYDTFSKLVEQIFPELEESEDEKMKRLIISTITLYWGDPLKDYTKGEQLINWLTKQLGNNVKPTEKFKREYGNWDYDEKQVNGANKVKPKFKPGDWIVNNSSKTVFLMKSFANGYYSFEDTKGSIFSPCLPPLENENHIWTIQDAKDGDILVSNNDPFIFKGLLDPKNPGCPVAYCGLDFNKDFIVGDGNDGGTNHWSSNEEIKPATKEQRDLLFEKMKESGYEWDSDKKKLIEIKVEAQDD